MSDDIVIANEDLSINDASRVMFRLGISRLPVTDENRKVLGIITNTDILRSHIERSTPAKVNEFRKTLLSLRRKLELMHFILHRIRYMLMNFKVELMKLNVDLQNLLL